MNYLTKIYNKIAIEPSSLSTWERFRYVMEKLGYSKGLLLAKFPKAWERELLDSLNVGDIERSRIVEKLRSYKLDRMIPSGYPYERSHTWIQNTIEIINESDIDKVLIADKEDITSINCQTTCIDEADEVFFKTDNEFQILNTPEMLCAPAELLLTTSNIAVFVDPYFKIYPKSDYLRSLSQCIIAASKSNKCNDFRVFIREDSLPKGKEVDIDNALASHISSDSEITVTFKFIDDKNSKYPMHARYFLTEIAGIRYDKGFRAESHPVHVDVSLIDQDLHKILLDRYVHNMNDYTIKYEYTWRSNIA